MARVVQFEIHAENPERAIKFYDAVWLVKTGPDSELGINGGLLPRRGVVDGQAVIAYVCTAQVAPVDDQTRIAEGTGGIVVVPKMAIPGVGWLASCKDTEGNIFGLMQADPKAA